MPMTCFALVLITLSIFALLRNRAQRSYKEKQDAFWEKEMRADSVRRKDLSGLDYIHIPLETFPIGRFDDAQLALLEQTLTDLSTRSILNLSRISNTDLKLTYGAANLPFLSECDANYTELVKTIAAYGKQLAALMHHAEAVTVLSFGVSCNTDIGENYTLLADLYRQSGEGARIDELIKKVRALDSIRRDSILKQLGA